MKINIAFFAAMLMLAAPLAAAGNDDPSVCTNGSGNARIEACTRLIDSGQLKGRALASDYKNRAVAESEGGGTDAALADLGHAIALQPEDAELYVRRGDIELQKVDSKSALVDYNHALSLEPDNPDALLGRGMIRMMHEDADGAIKDMSRIIELHADAEPGYPYVFVAYLGRAGARMYKGDLDGALADYDQVVARRPDMKKLLYGRGMVRFLKGDERGAADDFAQMEQTELQHGHYAIMRFLAEARAGKNAGKTLSSFAAQDGSKWPHPVIAFFLGKGTQASLMQDAAQSGPERLRHVCEANYYLAEWYLLKKDRGHALPLLHQVVDDCPTEADGLIRFSAHVRLMQLGK